MVNESFLKHLPFFTSWDEESLIKISSYCKLISLNKGSIIVQQDETSRDLYLLIKGSLALNKKMGHDLITFGHLKEGELFGELSFIDGEKRSCDVVADESSEILFQ